MQSESSQLKKGNALAGYIDRGWGGRVLEIGKAGRIGEDTEFIFE